MRRRISNIQPVVAREIFSLPLSVCTAAQPVARWFCKWLRVVISAWFEPGTRPDQIGRPMGELSVGLVGLLSHRYIPLEGHTVQDTY